MRQDQQNGEEQEPIKNGEVEPKAPLHIQVGVENGRVIVIFSEALTTFSLPHEEAYKMGGAMILHADEAKALVEPEESAIIIPE